jgi:predicted  nucleic acid-binding Zn-ribbon protein
MSGTVEDLRTCQLDIRLVQNKLQDITVEEKNHPAKTKPGDSHEKVERWMPIKGQFEKRRRALKDRLAQLQEERGELEHSLDHTPLSKASLGHVTNQLLDIEVKFTAETWEDAWDALNAFIDWLEKDEARVSQATAPKLKAVA